LSPWRFFCVASIHLSKHVAARSGRRSERNAHLAYWRDPAPRLYFVPTSTKGQTRREAGAQNLRVSRKRRLGCRREASIKTSTSVFCNRCQAALIKIDWFLAHGVGRVPRKLLRPEGLFGRTHARGAQGIFLGFSPWRATIAPTNCSRRGP
jgi:hypothetical protein